MAEQDRTTDHPLIADLLRRAQDYSFFQLVTLVERLCRPRAAVGGEGSAEGRPFGFDRSFPSRFLSLISPVWRRPERSRRGSV